ncbi:MAG TPA: matrixin family metalloprotease [Polyangiaceae bacterium]|nr:matrixin family metalloprotease [Polyangiaceae bacterium]
MRSARERVLHIPTSLMSAASAHTLKPSLESRTRVHVAGPAKKLSLQIIALAAASTAVGLAAAASLSHLRPRPAPIAQIVSGNPALKKGADGAHVRWHSQKSKVYFDASLENAGKHAREAVQLGFGTWIGTGAKLPNLEFDTTKGAKFGQVPNGKSEVMYGPITLAGHENDLALTVTFSDPKSGEVVESDMIFNSKHPYGILPYAPMSTAQSASTGNAAGCDQKYDLQSVATHEAGHFFGLGEDFDVKPATMFYTTGRCETNKRVLQNSDETTMSALYLASGTQASADEPNAESSAKGCGGAHIGQGRTNGSLPMLSLLGLLGFVAFRRRQS